MDHAALATLLAASDEPERLRLLAERATLVGPPLAHALKDLCYQAWSSRPEQALTAAAAMREVARLVDDAEVEALAQWTAGIAELIEGRMGAALTLLEAAEVGFERLGKQHAAASTLVSRLYPLAILGRYDEALQCGQRARDMFIAVGDLVAAGKIEQNLGNIAFRRDRYDEAEALYRAARSRFASAGARHLLPTADNGIANVLASRHRFREARELYLDALAASEELGQTITQAEIECNLGSLWLDQGQYDRALEYLERSRRRYDTLGMPHETAIAALEIADAYLELNLAPEAVAIYARVTPEFARLEMGAEQAHALAHHGRASMLLGEYDAAASLLAESRARYGAEQNSIGVALVTLAEAELAVARGDFERAARAGAQAEEPLAGAHRWRQALLARWVRAEAARQRGAHDEARRLLRATIGEAEQLRVPQVSHRALTSLGLLLDATGDASGAEQMLLRAVDLIETLGAPLPGEEFRAAFIADKLEPYTDLVRLCLRDGRADRASDALLYVERARSRALLDMLGGKLQFRHQPRDAFEEALVARLDELREELNWFYSRLNRPPQTDDDLSETAIERLQIEIREREATIQSLVLQLRQQGTLPLVRTDPVELAVLQRGLGSDTALVEYYSIHGELVAFVVTDHNVVVVRDLAREDQVEHAANQLRFQVGALRFGSARMRAHLPQLTERALVHLRRLHDWLIRPLEPYIGDRRLVVVPHRALHYVPFQAFHDGQAYLVQKREICYSPSAGVLVHCLGQPQREPRRALLMGLADELTPRVADEIAALASLFPDGRTLIDDAATSRALQSASGDVDLLHLACHGNFRPDNPLFSSLRLADGWLTVRDAYDLRLECMLVTLSACETGVSAIAPGDEIIGLARGFFSAGAPSLLVSLWMVDDETTASTMVDFYTRLRAGDRPAAALRYAQCRALERQSHPFFWSPFVLLGRW